MLDKFSVKTGGRFDMIDITSQLRAKLREMNAGDGLCCVYVSHTTAGVTINENADPAVPQDILAGLDKIAPLRANYKHMEGNSAAHIKSSIVGASATLILDGGNPVLGTWQSVFFCEFDGPRTRNVYVKYIKG